MTESTPPIDRRRLKRISCQGRPSRQSSVLLSGARSYSVSLIDLHMQGARVRFIDLSSTAAVDVGDACRFNILMDPSGLECGPVPCSITWKMGAELGVSFQGRLDMSMPGVQRVLEG